VSGCKVKSYEAWGLMRKLQVFESRLRFDSQLSYLPAYELGYVMFPAASVSLTVKRT
jgi:hypothetical protein